MHIAEGILTLPVLGCGAVLTTVGVAIGLRKIEPEKIPQVAVLTAGFFVASLVHIPVGFTSVHLVLNGLVGVLLGWVAFPVILVGLLLQAYLFGFGGVTVLGVNAVNMAGPAVLMYYVLRKLVINGSMRRVYVFGFLAGAGAVLGGAVMIMFCMLLAGEDLRVLAQLVLVGHVPVMVIEGLITGWILVFLRKVKPEIFTIFLKKVQKT